MKQLPIRLRVAAAFAVAMALVLAGTGLFVYARLGDDLSRALDQDLRLRAQDLSALVRSGHGSLAREGASRLVERGESFAQLVGPDGRVVDATPPLGGRSLLGPRELRAALRGSRFVDVPSVPGLDEPARLLALLRAELDFALHHAESEEELRAALREASAETDRLVQLAGDLLLIASADRGKLRLREERIAARELLESVDNRLAWRARED